MLHTGGLKLFNSFGFIVLVVFTAVVLTSISLSVPAERKPETAEISRVHEHMTPSTQRFEQFVGQYPLRN